MPIEYHVGGKVYSGPSSGTTTERVSTPSLIMNSGPHRDGILHSATPADLERIVEKSNRRSGITIAALAALMAFYGMVNGSREVYAQNPPGIYAQGSSRQPAKKESVQYSPEAAQAPNLIFAQFADGGGYRTQGMLTNPTERQESGTIEIKDGFGNPISVGIQAPTLEGVVTSSFPVTIPSGGTYRFSTDGGAAARNASSTRTGYITYTSTDPGSQVTGTVVFTYNGMEVSVKDSPPIREGHVFAQKDGTYNSGIAFVNLSDKASDITLILVDTMGAERERVALNLAPHHHTARFIDEYFSSAVAGAEGTVQVISENNELFAMLGLRLNNLTGAYTTLSGSPKAFDPLRANVTLNLVDVVDLAPVSGTSTFELGDRVVSSTTGNVSIRVPRGAYEINGNNTNMFPEWLLVRNDLNGADLEKRDVADLSSKVNITGDTTLYLIKIPNDFVGDKSVTGETITKDYFQYVFTTGRLPQFADPMNIVIRYSKTTTNPDTLTKANYHSVVEYIDRLSKRHRILPQEGGNLPASNYMDFEVNNRSPTNAAVLSGNTILYSLINMGSDIQNGGALWDVVFEEIFESMYKLRGTPNRAWFFNSVNLSGPAELSRFGNIVFHTADQFPAGTTFKNP